MKNFLKCLTATLLIALAFAVIVLYMNSETIHPNRDAILTIVFLFICMGAAMYVVNPIPVNRRVYGIYVCIGYHKFISRTSKGKCASNHKRYRLRELTGCTTYGELYRYASQEMYFKR